MQTSHVGSERPGNNSDERSFVQPHPTATVQRLTGPLGLCSFQYALLRYRLGSTSTNISYASLLSHGTVSAAARQPLPVFHVKPRESQNLSVSRLLTSKTVAWIRLGAVHNSGGEPLNAPHRASAFMEPTSAPLPRREPKATFGFT